MPGKDGTGPQGTGPQTGRGGGQSGRGQGLGPGGECLCPACGATASHSPGTPCSQIKCPKCGSLMIRK
ncbi:MAG: hypothetical protein JW864_10560 [Spirochaetes bacterium]|nr:hypothetical protein [Spirochaetota bacterium]